MRKFLMIAALGLATASAQAADDTTWMIYCEAEEHGRPVAYMTQSNWTADEHAARQAAEMAVEMLGVDGPMNGCSSVGFADPELASYRREQTEALHARFGTRVEYFDLPETAMAEIGSFQLVSGAIGRGE